MTTETEPNTQLAALDFLPERWSYECSIAVLVGNDCAPVAHELAKRGQRRLVVFLPEGGSREELPDVAVTLDEIEDFQSAFAALPGPPPLGAILHRVADPRVDSELLQDLAAELHSASRLLQQHEAALDCFGPTWALRGIGNLPRLVQVPSVQALENTFAGRPCAVVAPGPGLEAALKRLAELQDRAVIVASAHALGSLKRAGIRPHLVVAVEGEEASSNLEGAGPEAYGALVVAATAPAEMLGQPAAHTFSFAGNDYIDDWIFECIGENGRIGAGGADAGAAFGLAVRMGCGAVALVGPDRAGDEPPAGASDFDDLRRWFEGQARHLTEVRAVHCSVGQACIKGMEHATLESASAEWSPFDAWAAIDAAAARASAAHRRAVAESRLGEMERQLVLTRDLARECLALVGNAHTRPALVEKLGAREDRLLESLQPLPFLSLLAQRPIREAQREAHRAEELTQSLACSRRLYEVVVAAVAELLIPVRKARSDLPAGRIA